MDSIITFEACPEAYESDVAILHDTSCFNGLNQCNDDQAEFLAEVFSLIIGPSNLARAAWIRFDAHDISIDIKFDDPIYNGIVSGYDDSNEFVQRPLTEEDANALYNIVRDLPYTNTGGIPNLQGALDEAYKHFDVVANSDYWGRDKKIIIVSNSYLNQEHQDLLCDKNQQKLRTGSSDQNPVRGDNGNGFDVMMINFGNQAPLNYISCLVDYDDDRIFYAPQVELSELQGLIPAIGDEICSSPTKAPTTDPTVDPTNDPTNDPTPDPTTNPTSDPTPDPTTDPTPDPTSDPTADPTPDPTNDPTPDPTRDPTNDPTPDPTADPTNDPTPDPTNDPTPDPTVDPTNDPTPDPTNDPTSDPTVDPTSDPTTDPTSAPSTPPTNAPSEAPTPAPTHWPTPSPNMEACENGGKLDVVFCIDSSKALTTEQCADRNEFAGEMYTSVKGSKNIVRAAYIRFGADLNDTIVDISLDDYINTQLPPFAAKMNEIYNQIRSLSCETSLGDEPDLQSCLNEAYEQFDVVGNSDFEGRDKKIVILSNNYLTQSKQAEICEENEVKIRTGLYNPTRSSNNNGINVVMVNLGESPSNYISCLVEYDENRIYEEEVIDLDALDDLVVPIQQEVCSAPTSAPTTDPTADPTPDPTKDPTSDPTTDPTNNPTIEPTRDPTSDPTNDPTSDPTPTPTADPTVDPTNDPTNDPTPDPTNDPSVDPTNDPTNDPTGDPTINPTDAPTSDPTSDPTPDPTMDPSTDPTADPTNDPTVDPTADPTNDPSQDPTKNPTAMPTTSPTSEACILNDYFDIAIIVDNSCALTYQECLIQRDQIAELLTRVKEDNLVDNPKVTYIEYNSQGAEVRVSLDDPRQVSVRGYFDFIRNQGTCGDGGDGQTDLVSGLEAALNEFDTFGNPNAVKKMVMINNCKNAVINGGVNATATNSNNNNNNNNNNNSAQDSSDDDVDYEEDTICQDIAGKMAIRGIDGYVINIPAPRGRAPNVITNPTDYLLCLADNDQNRVYSSQRVEDVITEQEYIDAYDACITGLCSIPTVSPTMDPTRHPSEDPTPVPSPQPTKDPTRHPTQDPTSDPTTDPTSDPTPDPTMDPTPDPTVDPTSDPTPDPTNDPTQDPTPAPTNNPTSAPTQHPTPSPNMEACENGGYLDVVFCIDTSLATVTTQECEAQNEFTAELYTAVKGANNVVRAAYIRFGGTGSTPIVDVALNEAPYNNRDEMPLQSDMNILYNDIRDNTCVTNPGDKPDLDSCIAEAINQFDNVGNSDGIPTSGDDSDDDGSSVLKQRDKKIVIVNNNYLDIPKQDELCATYYTKLRTGLDGINPSRAEQLTGGINGINVIMVNLRDTAPDSYVECLVDYDPSRVFSTPVVNPFVPELEDIVIPCREEICSAPTPSPTTDPTNDPTQDPTTNPTNPPSVDPTNDPTNDPTVDPTANPTWNPTTDPTDDPTSDPTPDPTDDPTSDPTVNPTNPPTYDPTKVPTPRPTFRPSRAPTKRPTRWPSNSPTEKPSEWPTKIPTFRPSHDPTPAPTVPPTKPTDSPTPNPTNDFTTLLPSKAPTTDNPTSAPTESPSEAPTFSPTFEPTSWPTKKPTGWPSKWPTKWPTPWPTNKPIVPTTELPSEWPTPEPTPMPSKWPTFWPTGFPTPEPTDRPTTGPTDTAEPTQQEALSTCPICLADIDDDDDSFIDPYNDDYKGYYVELNPPKYEQFSAHSSSASSMANNVRNRDNSLPITNVFYTDNMDKNDGMNKHISDWSSISYLILLFILSCNVIMCTWYILRPDKKELILGYISGQQQHSSTKTLDECDVTDSDIDDDEYQTSTDIDNDDYTDDESDGL